MTQSQYNPPDTQSQSTDCLETALACAARGWYVFPCKPDKRPYWNEQDLPNGKDNATTDPEQIRTWWARWPNALVGVYCEKSGFFAVDIDVKDDRDGYQSWDDLADKYGAGASVVAGPIQQTPSGGLHVLFSYPEDLDIPNNANKLGPGLDLRSNGYICTGGPYTWLEDHGLDRALTDAPAWLLDLIRNLGDQRKNPAPAERLHVNGNGRKAEDAGQYWLEKALDKASPGNRNDTGFWLALMLRDAGLAESEATAVMQDYARSVPGKGYTEAEALASLQQAYKGQRREPARAHGFISSPNGNGYHHRDDLPPEPPADFEGELVRDEEIPLTDLGNARRFAQQHVGKVCFVKSWGWMVWTGKKWEQDETDKTRRLAHETISRLYAEARRDWERAATAFEGLQKNALEGQDLGEEAKKAAAKLKQASDIAQKIVNWGLKSQSSSRIDGMLKEAKALRPIVARDKEFDRDPWLLNVQNGVLDLRTGELKPHDPSLKLTKLAGAPYDPEASCPTWLAFLDRIFDGNQELIAFLQRAAGYSLTGNVGEQCLFFLHGNGANGKSTFTGALQEVMGDYSMKVRAETLMVKRQETSTEEVAQLAGVRFVLAAELGEGQRLNESLVKDLTGGDKLRARLLYQKSFEFSPSAKPWLYGNHKPIIRGTDEGIWRRVNLIPFLVRIPDAEKDKNLPEKLRAELPGILAWAVRGCLEWQRVGLQAPKEITAATAAFRAEQDLLAAFLEECCIVSSLASVTAGELYTAYKSWAEESGLSPMSKIAFSRALEERGYSTKGPDGKPRRKPGSGQALYLGIGLAASEADSSADGA